MVADRSRPITISALRRLRMARGLSACFVADKLTELAAPVTASTIRKWETGTRTPSCIYLPTLAAILGVGVDQLPVILGWHDRGIKEVM